MALMVLRCAESRQRLFKMRFGLESMSELLSADVTDDLAMRKIETSKLLILIFTLDAD
jgi:hypothetical protein